MLFRGIKVGFALTGSFCTIERIIPEIENIIKEGGEVLPIFSESVQSCDTRFGRADELKLKVEGITGRKIISSIVEAEPIGPKSLVNVMIVAPCTGNTMAKLANAITDTTVTMACKAHLRNSKPLVIAISTNDGLGANAKNIASLLNTKNVYLVPFEQDAPNKKPNSLVAKPGLIIPAVLEALKGRQIQPILYM